MKSPYFNADHESFRNEVRNFFTKEIIPQLEKCERNGYLSQEIWNSLGEQGLLGLHYPKLWGGAEKDFFYSVIFLEALGNTGYAGFRVAIAVHAYMATSYLLQFGSDFLKENYLRPAILGKKISALAITEKEAGSDLSQLQTTAVLENDCYVINGHKKFVANGSIADFFIMAVKTNPSSSTRATGISMMVVDAKTEGLEIKKLNNLGWHSSDTTELQLVNVKIPKKNMIGKINQGFFYIMQCMQLERLAAGFLALGGIENCLSLTKSYLSNRKMFNQSLNQFQTVRHKIANFMTDFSAIRQLAYHTAWIYQNNKLPVIECSMVKLKATELANQIAYECMQLHGAYGYQNESAISRILRDSQAATIAGGASEVMRDIIAQAVLGENERNELSF